jgi:hypothetical protein
MSIERGATGRFDGFIGALWRNLNNEGGTPAPTVTVNDGGQLVIEGGFEFRDGDIRAGKGTIRIEVIADPIQGHSKVVVDVDAEGSFPSFRLQGNGNFEDQVDAFRIQRRVFTLFTPDADKVIVTQRYFGSRPRWYPGVEFVFHPARASAVSIIFEDMSDDKLRASASRSDDPRRSPFDE